MQDNDNKMLEIDISILFKSFDEEYITFDLKIGDKNYDIILTLETGTLSCENSYGNVVPIYEVAMHSPTVMYNILKGVYACASAIITEIEKQNYIENDQPPIEVTEHKVYKDNLN